VSEKGGSSAVVAISCCCPWITLSGSIVVIVMNRRPFSCLGPGVRQVVSPLVQLLAGGGGRASRIAHHRGERSTASRTGKASIPCRSYLPPCLSIMGWFGALGRRRLLVGVQLRLIPSLLCGQPRLVPVAYPWYLGRVRRRFLMS
jgi:hypothetical protein